MSKLTLDTLGNVYPYEAPNSCVKFDTRHTTVVSEGGSVRLKALNIRHL